MDIYCDHCGYERHYTGAMNQVGRVCAVCGIGRLRRGRRDRGFAVTSDHQPVPRNLPLREYVVAERPGPRVPGVITCAAFENGDPQRDLESVECIGHDALMIFMVPEPQRFAWLEPYHDEYQRAHASSRRSSAAPRRRLARRWPTRSCSRSPTAWSTPPRRGTSTP